MDRIERVMLMLKCSYNDAARYLDLRDEGHNHTAAKLMAGISDPTETIEVYNDVTVTTPGGLSDA